MCISKLLPTEVVSNQLESISVGTEVFLMRREMVSHLFHLLAALKLAVFKVPCKKR